MSPLWQRIVFAVVTALLLLSFYDSPSDLSSPSSDIDQAIRKEDHDWHMLDSTRYGDFDAQHGKWLNVTGLRKEDGFAWQNLPLVKARARELMSSTLDSLVDKTSINGKLPGKGLRVYHNVSGYVSGKWIRSAWGKTLTKPLLEHAYSINSLNSPFRLPFHKNMTGHQGDISIEFEEEGEADEWQGMNARGVRARMQLTSAGSPDDTWVSLHGIHLLEMGSMVMITETHRFSGLFALPHFGLSEQHYQAFQHRLNRTLKNVIDLQRSRQYAVADPWSSSSDVSESPNCEFLIYLQQYQLPEDSDMRLIEGELRFPGGRGRTKAPQLHMSMLLYSPDCGFALESSGSPSSSGLNEHHLLGYKIEAFYSTASKQLLGLGFIILFQTVFMIRQSKEVCTPSTKNRVSAYSILILTLMDGLAFLTIFPLVTFASMSFMTIMALSAFALLQTAFDAQLFINIWEIQSEDAQRERRQRAPATTGRASRLAMLPIISAGSVDMLPLPVTSRSRTGPVQLPDIVASDGENLSFASAAVLTSREMQMVVFRNLAFSTVCLFVVTLMATTLSLLLRQLYFDLLALIYVSCWIPQIYRNAVRNCRKALRWEFVIAQSFLRLIPLLYFYAYEHNLADITPNLYKCAMFCGWSWTQICILAVQDVLGPRLFIPKSWVPPAYNYHPVLREDDENTQLILGYSSAPAAPSPTSGQHKKDDKKESKHERWFDCAICMHSVQVPIVANSAIMDNASAREGVTSSAFLWKRNYMITPCRHVFHTSCLEAAMRFRLQCPICREGLPSL